MSTTIAEIQSLLDACTNWRRVAAAALLAGIAQSVLALAVPLLLLHVFAEVLPQGRTGPLALACIAMLLLFLGQASLFILVRVAVLRTSKRAIARIREALIEKLYGLSRASYHAADRGRLHNTLVQDTERIDRMVNALFAELPPAVFCLLAVSGMLVTISWSLFLLLLLVVAPATLVLRAVILPKLKTNIEAFHRSFEKYSRATYRLLELMDLTQIEVAEAKEIATQRAAIEELERTS